MMSVALVSVGGAPGATTLACAAAAASEDHPLLVIESAPSGGVIAARWRLAARDTATTTVRLAMEGAERVDLWEVAHRPWLGSSRVIPGHQSAAVTRQAQLGHWLAQQLPPLRHPTVVDAGRLDGSADQLELLAAADTVWLLIDPIIEHVTAAKAATAWLNRTGAVEVLVREPAGDPARNSANAVADALGWPVIATVPQDEPAARALCGLSPARRNLARSSLLRTGRALAERLTKAEVPA